MTGLQPMRELHKSLDNAIQRIAQKRYEIVDDYCKALLAKRGGNESEIRENLEHMVIHESQCGAYWKYWVTFDGKMTIGEWEDIKSAPLDGTAILGFDDHNLSIRIYVMTFSKLDGGWIEAAGERYLSFEPSHWMPIPAKPEVAK